MDDVGEMRERIQIASLSVTRDAIGGEIVQWVLSDHLFAAATFRATGTDEVQASNQKAPDAKVDFKIRFRELSYTDEVEYRGERYKIEGLIPDARRAYLTIETKYHGNAAS